MARKAPSPNPPNLDVPVSYKTVFWVVVLLAVLSLAVSLYLATRPPDAQTDTLKKVVETCDSTWKMCCGAILGLLGGKRLP